jgi:predicted nucleic acid-binding protein
MARGIAGHKPPTCCSALRRRSRIVRYLTGDHPKRSARARRLIDGNDVFVSTTVLLETEWVLRSVYGFAGGSLVAALRGFAGLPRVTIEDAGLAAQALDWTEASLDFADALHLAKALGAVDVCAP